MTPEFQGNLRLRYDWISAPMRPTALATQFADNSYSSIVSSERQEQASYSLLNARLALKKTVIN